MANTFAEGKKFNIKRRKIITALNWCELLKKLLNPDTLHSENKILNLYSLHVSAKFSLKFSRFFCRIKKKNIWLRYLKKNLTRKKNPPQKKTKKISTDFTVRINPKILFLLIYVTPSVPPQPGGKKNQPKK